MSELVVAVVLNYNNAAFTVEAASSVLAQRPAPRLVVVDNGSRFGVVAEIRHGLPAGTEVIELPDNLGVPGALGVGLRRSLELDASASLIVLNDTSLEPGALALLTGRLHGDATLAAVAPLQVEYDDPQRVVTSGSRLLRLPWLVARRTPGQPRALVQSRPVPEPDYLDFTCLLVSNEVLRRVGLPRAEFRFYWDDAEWGVRVRRAGWHLAVEPQAVVRHRVSGTLSATKGSTATYYQYRNRLLAKQRLDGPLGVAGLLAREPLLLAGRAALRGRDGGGTAMQVRAALDFLRRRPYPPL